jgi:hypothetical protein
MEALAVLVQSSQTLASLQLPSVTEDLGLAPLALASERNTSLRFLSVQYHGTFSETELALTQLNREARQRGLEALKKLEGHQEN